MDYDYYKEKRTKKFKGKVILISIIALIIFKLLFLAGIYFQIIQLDEIGGYSKVFIKNFTFKIIFFIISFIIIFTLAFVSAMLARKNIINHYKDIRLKRSTAIFISSVFAFIGAYITQNNFYLKALTFLNSEKFGKLDPLFNKDIGYYVFERPFLISIYDFVYGTWFFIIAYTLFYYIFSLIYSSIKTNTEFEKNDIKEFKTMIIHNILNIAILFIIKTFSYNFQKEGILFSSMADGLKGGGYIDVNIWLKYYQYIPIVLIIITITSFIFVWKGKLKKAAYTIAIFPIISIIMSIFSSVTYTFIVKPNELAKQQQYLKYNIQKTREAYKLDEIRTHNFPEIESLSPEIVSRNPQTIDNIRIVDYKSTVESNKQIQRNTNFYTFSEGDVINYDINGKDVPVFITAREIDKKQLPDKNYLNTVFKYTHGYGIVINPINKVTQEGQIDFLLSGLRMTSIDPTLKISEPRIYYGELTKDRVIVNAANLKEVDYDGNTETKYTGKSGIKLNFLNKLLFSLKYADFNMLVSGYVSDESKILINRQIVERAQKALPFLMVDKNPYIVLTDDGRLKWVLDAYTMTDKYPYSQGFEQMDDEKDIFYEDMNYVRNSAKVIVDAYDGKVECYIIDKTDPIIKVYNKIYPGTLIDKPFPQEIARHMKYPEYLFKIQTEMLKKYHLLPNDVSTFFSKHDLWQIARYSGHDQDDTGEEDEKISPYYNMIKLPGNKGDKEEMILMRPFTPSNEKSHNMVSWLAVRNSFENYGEIILFKFPKNRNIFGPKQIDIKINQIDKISKDKALWRQSGSRYYTGDLLVIPIENSVLYVQPIYIQAAGESSIPEMREVVVGYQTGNEFKYGIGTDLTLAINDLFKTGNAKSIEQVKEPIKDKVAEPNNPEEVQNQQKVIDEIFSKYDTLKKQLDEMGSLIDKLKK